MRIIVILFKTKETILMNAKSVFFRVVCYILIVTAISPVLGLMFKKQSYSPLITKYEEAYIPIYEEKSENKSSLEMGLINLVVNPVADYKSMTKQDIYELRKKYVAESLFKKNDYVPSEYVFGQIADKAPWYGLDYSGCISRVIGTKKVVQGPSEESRFVNNPNMLVGVISGSQNIEPDSAGCFDEKYWVIPSSFTYNPKIKTITAKYSWKYLGPMALVGINAKDLGYDYAFVSAVKNVNFKSVPNISTAVYQFRDFIHLGGTCRYKNGCNNASPYQSELAYSFSDFPASFTIKLWKNKPKDKNSLADINYVIIFE